MNEIGYSNPFTGYQLGEISFDPDLVNEPVDGLFDMYPSTTIDYHPPAENNDYNYDDELDDELNNQHFPIQTTPHQELPTITNQQNYENEPNNSLSIELYQENTLGNDWDEEIQPQNNPMSSRFSNPIKESSVSFPRKTIDRNERI
mmetsp:Transcript_17551/g.18290  ORF Transcript_17551/g.18290 Transcript_17551/m.18290 type:complete len:146 (-) Transcript_17551:31-468(-)|eukprot:CAMPEP_0174819488 /NCGR_PEP_ID=MMETSP1107-20130205/2762_1 /TAXON_ID=36770 /ORGANISM="Paraphysomonas vestita, Strain GFlagA" /LENGTH=145 /DNA_ID=CAMNT_0016033085 /DNA_START=2670 /DNA_END=3107 /DNA_ORIENTATION=-